MSLRSCPSEAEEAICSIIYCAPHLNIEELSQVVIPDICPTKHDRIVTSITLDTINLYQKVWQGIPSVLCGQLLHQ